MGKTTHHMWFRKPKRLTELEKLANYRPHPSLNWQNPDWVFSPRSCSSSPLSSCEESNVSWTTLEEEDRDDQNIRPVTIKDGIMDDAHMHQECSSVPATEEPPTNQTTTETATTQNPLWVAPMLAWTKRMKLRAAEANDANSAKKAKREASVKAVAAVKAKAHAAAAVVEAKKAAEAIDVVIKKAAEAVDAAQKAAEQKAQAAAAAKSKAAKAGKAADAAKAAAAKKQATQMNAGEK